MTFFENLLHSKRTRRASALAAILCICAGSLCADLAGQSVGSADPTRYLDDVKALTAPAMEGRGDGTKGLTLAARMLEKRYRQLGLKPAGSNSYFQPFTLITGAKLRSSRNRFAVDDAAQKRELKLNQDFVPFSFSSSGFRNGPGCFRGIRSHGRRIRLRRLCRRRCKGQNRGRFCDTSLPVLPIKPGMPGSRATRN